MALTFDDIRSANTSFLTKYGPFPTYADAENHAERLGLKPDGIGYSSKKKLAYISTIDNVMRIFARPK